MARFLEVHPVNPQARAISQVVAMLRDDDALIAYPTDSCYALGARLDSVTGPERIREIRDLDAKHDFTLVCSDFHQLGALVSLDNWAFRAIKAATPGAYTFILPATKEVPRRLHHPKKKTVGVRIPQHPVVRELLRELGEPLLSSTLLMPGASEPLTDGWQINEEIGHLVDAVLDSGECGTEPTTVVDLSSGEPEVVRVGAGDPTPFE
jgi:tRNA threonylcarbamoyl adenosine modification protein (Sua5/YciO/YrdC/YwlC family)